MKFDLNKWDSKLTDDGQETCCRSFYIGGVACVLEAFRFRSGDWETCVRAGDGLPLIKAYGDTLEETVDILEKKLNEVKARMMIVLGSSNKEFFKKHES